MRLRRLALLLDRLVPPIPAPSPQLEQYTTPSELALRVAERAVKLGGARASYADLGAGTCRLAVALAMMGAPRVAAVEYDERLCPLCFDYSARAGYEGVIQPLCSWIAADSGPLAPGRVDVIVMNPPYGVWRRGADREFIEYSLSLGARGVVAILKSGNFAFHSKLASKHNYNARLLWRDTIEIPYSMPHHRSRIRRVHVDVIEFTRG